MRLCIALIFLGLVLMATPHFSITAQDCHYEKVILIQQFLADEPAVGNFTGCEGCLHIRVQPENLPYTRVYYFAFEKSLKKDWKPGDTLIIQWCRVGDDWVIRGVRRG